LLQATSALDTITENSIQEALVTLGRNRTVLVIAHRLSTVKHAQQIVVMDAGRVIEVGSHEELLKDPNSTYSRMWDMQSSSIGNRSPVGPHAASLFAAGAVESGSPKVSNPLIQGAKNA
jgi:ABC-type dipeptide/oligopeptide/nickel transport system ATPase component